MLQIDKLSPKPYYIQIYDYFKHEIESGRMRAGTKLPSMRSLARYTGISKLTVEKAYFQLANEGYIVGHRKARFEAAALSVNKRERAVGQYIKAESGQPPWKYDFASGDVDLEGFPLILWRRYMHRVLSDPAILLAGQDEQGAPALREALSGYMYETRGVHAAADNIVIGNGVTPLLRILGYILRNKHSRIAVEEPGFRLGREVFRSGGYEIVPLPLRDDGLDVDALAQADTGLVYVTPSHQFPTGKVMPVGQRYKLLDWAVQEDGLIIEDDYDSELRYEGRPIPALQGLDRSDRVIYLGALSKVLPFFVRISYLVLPDPLMDIYRRERSLFRQSASVPEQCVLAEYIRSGEMRKQIRRLRRLYQEKGRKTEYLLQAYFGTAVEVSRVVSGVHCQIAFASPLSETELTEAAKREGCLVLPMESFYEKHIDNGVRRFLLSFARIRTDMLEEAVAALHRAWTAGGVRNNG